LTEVRLGDVAVNRLNKPERNRMTRSNDAWAKEICTYLFRMNWLYLGQNMLMNVAVVQPDVSSAVSERVEHRLNIARESTRKTCERSHFEGRLVSSGDKLHFPGNEIGAPEAHRIAAAALCPPCWIITGSSDTNDDSLMFCPQYSAAALLMAYAE
jgi:hypothetical protein